MQPSIGEIIRQVRQLRNLTQQALGGDRYSKSYVSAVELNRISPSPRALRFFAERLGQPNGNFAALLQQPDVAQSLAVLDTPALPATNGHITRNDTVMLLQTLLEQSTSTNFSPDYHLPTLSPETLASLPQDLQARYYFLLGLHAKERHNLTVALQAFESALALARSDQQGTVLDEMGNCYAMLHSYHTALGYHLHAWLMQSKTPSRRKTPSLELAIELHCGDDYKALGAYQQALAHYESARQHLSAQHDLSTAAKLYAGLGYCTFASIYPATMPPVSIESWHHQEHHIPAAGQADVLARRETAAASTNQGPYVFPTPPLAPTVHDPNEIATMTPEEIVHAFKHALSLLLQSRSFFQVSGNRLDEASISLTTVNMMLAFCRWQRRQMSSEYMRDREERSSFTDCTRFLDDAEERCQQLLLTWQNQHAEIPPNELDTIFYTTLACLIRVSIERAILARLEGSSLDTAYRKRAFAAYLCQQVLESLSDPSLPWDVIQQAMTSSANTLAYRPPALPRFDDVTSACRDSSHRSKQSLMMVYLAAGEVMEELGRVALTPDYAHDCYVQANQYFQAVLSLALSLHVKGERDPGYLARYYQHCISILEERVLASPALAKETTIALLEVLKNGFWHMQHPFRVKKTLQ
jgi:tetratricopeptide (TPR) repeat protein